MKINLKLNERNFFTNVAWGAYVIKNCEAFVSGPEFAMETMPRELCCKSNID